jgi:hypothetical protein
MVHTIKKLKEVFVLLVLLRGMWALGWSDLSEDMADNMVPTGELFSDVGPCGNGSNVSS